MNPEVVAPERAGGAANLRRRRGGGDTTIGGGGGGAAAAAAARGGGGMIREPPFLDRYQENATHPTLTDAAEIDSLFPQASFYAICMWLFSLATVYAASDEWKYLDVPERQAAAIGAGCLAIATILFLAPTLVHRRSMSGILLGSLTVQSIAFFTNIILASAPVPVAIDPVIGCPVYLVRWCEWMPLSCLMTFMSQAVDVPKGPTGLREPISLALWQFASCACGIVFPFCPDPYTWWAVMTFSMITYFFMFPACLKKMRALQNTARGATFLAMEHYDRVWFASRLLLTCTVVWTVLVLIYFINMIIYMALPASNPIFKWPVAMIADTLFDVLAKAFYMKLIFDVHASVFDREGRAQRQLGELRQLMNILWDSSADAICICVKHQDRITAMLSPSFATLVGAELPIELQSRDALAIMVEIEQLQTAAAAAHHHRNAATMTGGRKMIVATAAHYVDSSTVPYGGALRHAILASIPADSALVQRAVDVITAVSNRFHTLGSGGGGGGGGVSGGDSLLMVHPLQRITSEECRCEIKLSRHTEYAFISIMRDVTERYRRFEAEQRAHSETVQRQRDAAAVNRFTRHEVKNGLLGGIELCDSLRNSFESLEQSLQRHRAEQGPPQAPAAEEAVELCSTESSRRIINEMDGMLHEVLDTVLAEAMARDVIHEVHKPRLERLDVKGLLMSCNVSLGSEERFPLEVKGELPYLMLDPQLLRYIHRNAFSNACRYGKKDGRILTVLEYDHPMQLFEMQVINEPGAGHEELVDMGNTATEAVFRPGTRLPANSPSSETQSSSLSNGDGAWIMQKCAKTLGGSCRISFERLRTIFTFCCPAEALSVSDLPATEDFEVPPGTWGVAIDDSLIQRKLMNRIFAYCGVEESKRITIGTDAADCVQLGDICKKILNEDAKCKLLVVVDETLDFTQRDLSHVILSGSLIMKDVLTSLPPEQEGRVFALVRSANDSTDEVATYLERVHGFFPKAPMTRERVREILAPLWAERFMSRGQSFNEAAAAVETKKETPVTTATTTSNSSADEDDDDEDDVDMKSELMASLGRVTKLLEDKSYDQVPWAHLWGALHALKGDLMVMEDNSDLEMATMLISSMRGDKAPREFQAKWVLVKELVTNALEAL